MSLSLNTVDPQRKAAINQATAIAPACVGNVGVGFDILGHTLAGPCDRARVRRLPEREVRISAIDGCAPGLPLAANDNTAGVALLALQDALQLNFGFELQLTKGIALGSGMGGSAASCVAALVAANALLPRPLTLAQLYPFALQGEAVASGALHGDNVGPMLIGGLALTTAERLVPIPVPLEWHCALVHPHQTIQTRAARAALAASYPLPAFVTQSANLALVLAGCFRGDAALVRAGLADVLIEPRRAPLIPGYARVKQAALDHSALGASISGGGPSVFGWFQQRLQAERAAAAMQTAFKDAGSASDAFVAPLAGPAARLLADTED